ncbi:adenylate/guanylate cyclase domain-containing protein [Roseibium sediminicola]|uniref:Adenylate/guanylate cyclase domain-containing protein n=1 Tax=Roseibium sediminicola TaxID=2933272 RepID=A0ABT0H2B0_9HYPH|nr:adenylate/guanylate cyclase domain-containing protein [Roseibium sp. CAU 1639]MCK7615830.1 adenylate/guanylate cyclase domain-containing protein [Roseibium sp. CAU 1639]
MAAHRKLFITPTLASVIGAFVLVTAAAILIIQAVTSASVVRELGGTLVDIGMDSAQTSFVEQLHPITETAEFTRLSFERKELRFDDPDLLISYLYGALAPMEQVSFLVLVDDTGLGVDVDRGDADGTLLGGDIDLAADVPILVPLTEEAKTRSEAFWSAPFYMPGRKHTYYVYVRPLFEGKTYRGSLLIGMSLDRVSEITWHASTDDITVFLVQEGSHKIVGHPDLHKMFDELSADSPLPDIARVPDAFLKNFADMPKLDNASFDISEDLDLHVGFDGNGVKRFVILEQKNVDLLGLPVRIGTHFPAQFLDQPLEQLLVAVAVGAGLLLLSLIGAVLLAQRIARPVQRASGAAKEVASLNLSAVEPLPASVIRELDDLSKGFNAMVSGLKAFNRYVPTTLVQKLLREGRAEAPPEEREVAVLFTDIAGFTSASEGMSATETAAFVNHHLSLLGAEITKEGGTIDKYIGDSVMAFWGAPERLDNPAEPAARAALGMARAIRADNEERTARGEPPVRIRIGLHLGPLVVGDIGAPERVNYTVIGDTVNAASRLESLGKEIDDSADVIILASGDIDVKLSDSIDRHSIGLRKVKGKAEAVEVVRLL